MRFLEKNLETIIWEHPSQCYDLGLEPAWAFALDSQCLRWRQLHLGVFGVADLVSVCYNPNGTDLTLTVLECKRNVIGVAAYVQAKRYMTALDTALEEVALSVRRNGGHVNKQIVLVGATADTTGDFNQLLLQDSDCHAYTYQYGPSGIEFLCVDALLPAGYSTVASFPLIARSVAAMVSTQNAGFEQYERNRRQGL